MSLDFPDTTQPGFDPNEPYVSDGQAWYWDTTKGCWFVQGGDIQSNLTSGPDFPQTVALNHIHYLTDTPVGTYMFIEDASGDRVWVSMDQAANPTADYIPLGDYNLGSGTNVHRHMVLGPMQIAYGSYVSQGSGLPERVTFNRAFSAVPSVTVTGIHTTNPRYPTVGNVTTTGFDLYRWTDYNVGYDTGWTNYIAIGPAQ